VRCLGLAGFAPDLVKKVADRSGVCLAQERIEVLFLDLRMGCQRATGVPHDFFLAAVVFCGLEVLEKLLRFPVIVDQHPQYAFLAGGGVRFVHGHPCSPVIGAAVSGTGRPQQAACRCARHRSGGWEQVRGQADVPDASGWRRACSWDAGWPLRFAAPVWLKARFMMIATTAAELMPDWKMVENQVGKAS